MTGTPADPGSRRTAAAAAARQPARARREQQHRREEQCPAGAAAGGGVRITKRSERSGARIERELNVRGSLPSAGMIAVVDYRAGNAPSVLYALEHLGLPARLVSTPPTRSRPPSASSSPASAPPAPPSTRCVEQDLVAALTDRVQGDGVPFLGICIGLQVLFDHSEEGDTDGLGWVPGTVRRFPDTGRVPQIGWNRVRFTRPHPLDRGRPRRRPLLLRQLVLLRARRSRRRARRHRLHGRVLLGRRARQRRRHPVPRREERPARSRRCCAPSRRGRRAVLTKRLIACFDVVNGRVTKAQQFQDNIDVAPAEELAQQLYADQIDEIVFYDIKASAEKRKIDLDTVRRVAHHVFVPVHRRRRHPRRRRHVRGAEGGRREDQRRLDGGAQSRDHPRRRARRSVVSAWC